jgi:TatD DNase family protein
MIDSHVHLNRHEFKGQWAPVVDRALDAGVQGFLNVGYDLPSSKESIALAESHGRILATVGIHPHDAAELADEQGELTPAGREILRELEDLAAHPRVVALGEMGLDFYRDLSPRPAQRAALIAQLELADKLNLPVIFHVRDAWDETLALLDEVGAPRAGGVLHSFSGQRRHVDWARENGLLLGIGGPVTYKNSQLPSLLDSAGLPMLLLETDAPWLPPVPYRGKRNESAYLAHTCAAVARILQMEPQGVAAATSANFRVLFGGDRFEA